MVHPHREDEPENTYGLERFAERVLLVGWDGADWSVLRRLLSEGRLPNLASLLQRGVCLELVAPRPHETDSRLDIVGDRQATARAWCAPLDMPLRRQFGGTSPCRDRTALRAAIWNILSRAKSVERTSWDGPSLIRPNRSQAFACPIGLRFLACTV